MRTAVMCMVLAALACAVYAGVVGKGKGYSTSFFLLADPSKHFDVSATVVFVWKETSEFSNQNKQPSDVFSEESQGVVPQWKCQFGSTSGATVYCSAPATFSESANPQNITFSCVDSQDTDVFSCEVGPANVSVSDYRKRVSVGDIKGLFRNDGSDKLTCTVNPLNTFIVGKYGESCQVHINTGNFTVDGTRPSSPNNVWDVLSMGEWAGDGTQDLNSRQADRNTIAAHSTLSIAVAIYILAVCAIISTLVGVLCCFGVGKRPTA